MKAKTIIGTNMTDVKKKIKKFLEMQVGKVVIKGIEPFFENDNLFGIVIIYEDKEVAE